MSTLRWPKSRSEASEVRNKYECWVFKVCNAVTSAQDGIRLEKQSMMGLYCRVAFAEKQVKQNANWHEHDPEKHTRSDEPNVVLSFYAVLPNPTCSENVSRDHV